MKKFIVLAALAAFMLGASGVAHALDVKATGEFKASYTYWANQDWTKSKAGLDQQKHNSMQHRARVYFNFRANENVNMNVAFEIGTTLWGREDRGGDISADAVAVKVKRAYLEFKWPTYQSLVTTVGTMGIVFPESGYFYSAIMDDDVSGITVANKWNETVSTLLGFWRLYDADTSFAGARVPTGNTGFDATLLAAPLTFDNFKMTPFLSLGFVGGNVDRVGSDTPTPSNYFSLGSSSGTGDLKSQAAIWWTGSSFEVNMLDPFTIFADFNYGRLEERAADKRSGWLADLAVQYDGLSWFVPSISGWYASGVDGNMSNGDERMPVISGSWTQSNMLNAGGRILNDDTIKIAYIGTWGLGAKIEKLSFVDDLRHDVVFSFYQGTNDKDAVTKGADLTYGTDLTEKDRVFAIDLSNTYKIMKELSLIADLGIAWPSFDKNTWRGVAGNAVDHQTQMWRTSVGFVYKF